MHRVEEWNSQAFEKIKNPLAGVIVLAVLRSIEEVLVEARQELVSEGEIEFDASHSRYEYEATIQQEIYEKVRAGKQLSEDDIDRALSVLSWSWYESIWWFSPTKEKLIKASNTINECRELPLSMEKKKKSRPAKKQKP